MGVSKVQIITLVHQLHVRNGMETEHAFYKLGLILLEGLHTLSWVVSPRAIEDSLRDMNNIHLNTAVIWLKESRSQNRTMG